MNGKEAAWKVTWLATALAMGLAGYAIFFVAPEDVLQHNMQRIFYFHVSIAWAAFFAFFISFFGCIGYLASRQREWDWLAVSTAEVGLAFTTATLILGSIWGKKIWGTWWTWDPRLTTAFFLELLYISYLILRAMIEEPERRAMFSAVFGIFAFLDVPLCYFSIVWWRTLHPQPLIGGAPGTGMAPGMWRVFLFVLVSITVLTILMIRDRYRLEVMRYQVQALASDLDEREESEESKGVTA